MKLKSFLLKMTALYFFLFSSVLIAQQYPHIPVGHNHTGTPICWAYATVRTFQHFGQVHSGCNAASASGITGLSGNSYFTRYSWSLSGVQKGDIVEFREGTQDHAAFVANKYSSSNSGIILDQLDGSVKQVIHFNKPLTAFRVRLPHAVIPPVIFALKKDTRSN